MFSGAKTTAPSAYNLTKSLRFKQSAGSYLSRTYGTPTSTQIGTMAFWYKIGLLSGGTSSTITMPWGTVSTSTGNGSYIQFSGDNLRVQDNTSGANIFTAAVYRDTSAWYHIVVAIDTTQATATNRVKIYVNGVQITSFGTNTAPTQNSSYGNFVSGSQYIGYSQPSTNRGADGYMAEAYYIDGQQLPASSFGSFNVLTGVWQPAHYSGTYGNNGFYLPFTNTASTTTLGYDFSGNGNNWTTNNISLTAGQTYDSMPDVPTLTSSSVANYCTFNPLLAGSGVVLSNGNLWTTNNNGTSGWVSCGTTIAIPTSGKWYIELTVQTYKNGYTGFGFYRDGSTQLVGNGSSTGANDPNWWSQYGHDSHFYNNGVATAGGTTWSSGTMMLAFDSDNGGKPYWGVNGTWLNSANPATNTGSPYTITRTNGQNVYFIAEGYNGIQWSINCGQQSFVYTPPTGFSALNTYNLPSSTIVKGNSVMDATLYTGNGSTNTITNASGFQPDLIWQKSRSTTYENNVWDSVRGTATLVTNGTYAENPNGTSDFSTYNANGFTVNQSSNYQLSASGTTYVAWQWQAGKGTTSTNTNGSVTTTVSVNATAGFSIVSYTGTGANATFGHGLGVAPSMIICKSRSASNSWVVGHSGLTNWSYFLNLNNTQSQTSASTVFNSTAPTSTVFSLGSDGTANGNGATNIAYCWAAIPGFSAFGSYIGNGSSTGPFIYTGFQPRFIMTKCTSTTSHWVITDNARNPYNVTTEILMPDSSSAETTGEGSYTFLSNGFACNASISNEENVSGATYIYAAFASNPFKNSLAL